MYQENESVFISFIDGDIEEKEILRDSMFTGDVARWANRRTRLLGDLIIPKQAYVEWVDEEPHNVFWVEHRGLNPQSEEIFHAHHIVCDCAATRSLDDGGQGIDTSLCEVMQSALNARAQYIDTEFGIGKTLASYNTPVLAEYGAPIDYQDVVLDVMKGVLLWDRQYPEQWFGNVVSGQHHIPLMSEMLHQPPEVVRIYAEIMELKGEVETDGDVIRLAA